MSKISRIFRKVGKGFRYLKAYGIRATWRKINRQRGLKKASLRVEYTEADFAKQRKTRFSKKIKFSILVPLYNTPIPFLKEMIGSVLDQTYSNWELCLADGSDEKHANVGEEVLKMMENEPRILYRKLEKNLGISENTNVCIDMATGDYIALFDHDDV
ncbi:MAG: glycosyltransferase, partial [Clostridia bacterium]|nr:glycosyltransferase [Clostridia bacterium]